MNRRGLALLAALLLLWPGEAQARRYPPENETTSNALYLGIGEHFAASRYDMLFVGYRRNLGFNLQARVGMAYGQKPLNNDLGLTAVAWRVPVAITYKLGPVYAGWGASWAQLAVEDSSTSAWWWDLPFGVEIPMDQMAICMDARLAFLLPSFQAMPNFAALCGSYRF